MEPLTSYRKELRTLRAETFFLLGDPNEERFNVIHVVEKLNEACLIHCLQTQLIKEEINIQLEKNQFEYDPEPSHMRHRPGRTEILRSTAAERANRDDH